MSNVGGLNVAVGGKVSGRKVSYILSIESCGEENLHIKDFRSASETHAISPVNIPNYYEY